VRVRVETFGPVCTPADPRGSSAPGSFFALCVWSAGHPRTRKALSDSVFTRAQSLSPFRPRGGIGVSTRKSKAPIFERPQLLCSKHRSPLDPALNQRPRFHQSAIAKPLSAPWGEIGVSTRKSKAPHALTRAQTHRAKRPRYIMGAGALRTAAPKGFWPTRARYGQDNMHKLIFARVPLPRY